MDFSIETMNSESLITFVAIAETRNFTRAAEELFITQPTVTARIMALESELGVTLLVRNHKGLQLTQAGETYLTYAKRLLDLERTASQNVRLADTQTQLLRIGANESIFEGFLVPRLKALMQAHPEYRLKISTDASTNLFEKQQEGLYDLIYTYIPFKKKGFICTQIGDEPFNLVVSPSYPEAKKEIHLEKLLRSDLIFTNYAVSFTNQWMQELFPPYYIFPLNIHDGTKALRLILSGFGYGILPHSLCAPYIGSGQLMEVNLLGFHLPRCQYYAIRTDDCPDVTELITP